MGALRRQPTDRRLGSIRIFQISKRRNGSYDYPFLRTSLRELLLE